MTSLLFVAAADLHFDEQGPWRYRGIVGDAAFALSQIVDYCQQHKVPALWLLGDLMNRSTPRQSAVKEIHAQFDRLQSLGVPTFYILGDHDGRQDWPGLHAWPRHADGLCVPTGSYTAYGLDYLPKGKLQSSLAMLPQEASILMTHQKWEEFLSKSGQARLTQVPLHVPYVLTGDYHDQVWATFGKEQYVWSPGSTHATSVADSAPRCFIVGRETSRGLTCEFIQLKSRSIHRFRAEDANSLAMIIGPQLERVLAEVDRTLPKELCKPIVDVEYFTDIPDAYDRLQTIADRCHVFPRPRDRERQKRRDAAQLAKPSLTIEEALARLAKAGTPGYDWTVRLLNARDRRAEWNAIVEEARAT